MPDLPTVFAARARRALARPNLRRVAAVVLAVVTGLVVTSLVSSAEAARNRWGRSRPVAVAAHDLSPGDVIDRSAVEVRRLPEAAVTPAALRAPPAGAVVRQQIAAGEPLVAVRLAPRGLSPVAALVPDGHRAVAVPVGTVGAPPLSVGDRVDVLGVVAAAAEAAGSTDEPAFRLVDDAVVVAVGEQSVSVAVPAADAARVAWTLTNGSVVLALSGA